MKIIARTSLYSAACFLCVGFSGAQEDVSRALGVQPEQFSECVKSVSPGVQPERPSRQRTQANRRNLLSCLQKVNPDLTGEQLDEAMNGRRPDSRT